MTIRNCIRGLRSRVRTSRGSRVPRRRELGQAGWAGQLEALEARTLLSSVTASGDTDGDRDFDANDAFLIQLVKLSGTNAQIDASKGPSSLAATQIRDRVSALESVGGDTDGDGDFDANDAFLIQLVKLAGTNAQIDASKGASSLTAAQVRENVDALADEFDPEPVLIRLSEGNEFLTQSSLPVTIGADTGTHTVEIDVDAAFDLADTQSAVDDIFQIYVIDPTSGDTLLDIGNSGSPVFSLGESWFEAASGIVQFDGRTVSISTESLLANTDAQLRFQLLNGDRDTSSVVRIVAVNSVVDEDGVPANQTVANRSSTVPGEAIDTTTLVPTSAVRVELEEIQFESASGDYRAVLVAENHGDTTFRNVAVVFPNLPDRVAATNASGVDLAGDAYFNLSDSLPLGGLFPLGRSGRVAVRFSNPDLVRFFLEPQVLVNAPNTAPTLPAIAPQTIVPGEVLALPLNGSDANGDPLSYFIESEMALPTGEQDGDTLYFAPSPEEIGRYEFDVVVTDGLDETRQSVTLDVVADTLTTTRVRGIVQNVDQEPLPGIRTTIGSLESFTDQNGVFFFETNGALPDDTVKIHAQDLGGDDVYPFIAERLPLVLDHEVYVGALNDIERPIYLPVLDVAGGSTINPGQMTVVEQEIAAGEMAAVTVAAGSLTDQQGNDFAGVLSITEVPRDLTPAALPPELIPDAVVTIQPGEMQFNVPAPLTMPNRAGYFPGEEMDLWSINPETGDFDIVGRGRVTDDGTQIETIEGGIRNSSWHMFTPPARQSIRNQNDPKNEQHDCTDCPDKETADTDDDGDSNSQGGARSMVPDASVHRAPINPDFMPGANPFSRLQLPSGLNLNLPAVDFGGGLTLPGISPGGSSSSGTGAGGSLSNPFGFGIQQGGTSGPGRNSITGHRGSGAAGGVAERLPGSTSDIPAPVISDALLDNALYSPIPLDGGRQPVLYATGTPVDRLSGLASQFTTSEVELHSGSQIENHQLVTYHSLGADRGLSLTYDSRRADPIHMAFMGYDNARGGNGRLLTGGIEVLRGGFSGSKDATPTSGISERQRHYRAVGSTTRSVEIPVPIDLTSTPSGIYDYKSTVGLVQRQGDTVSGRTNIRDGEIVTVNTVDSPYGAGWGIDGLIELTEMADGRVLWVDGGGGQFPYRISATQSGTGTQYDNPPGDFSVFEKLPNGRFQRTSKTQTVWAFNADSRLESISDRNGNATTYEYDAAGRLTKMTDPVGLETTLTYAAGGQLRSVTDPTGRVTAFNHDAAGNLTRITDPDNTSRTFGYDGRHHLISEVDKRGNREEVRYDELGRVEESIRRDLSSLRLQTVQKTDAGATKSKSLRRPAAAPDATPPEATFADANGNVTTTIVNRAGLETGRRDEEGPLPTFDRDANNLVVRQTDGRGNVTQYSYDDRGNLLTMQDQVARDAASVPSFDASFNEPILAMSSPGGAMLAAGDLDGDGDIDFVGDDGQRLISNSDGSLQLDGSDTFATANFIQLLDMNGDGSADWVYGRGNTLFIDVNDGNGGRTASDSVVLNLPTSSHRIQQFHAADYDGNGMLDLFVLFQTSNSASALFGFVPGNGDGTFGNAVINTASNTLSSRASLTAFDYDNDGDIDPIVGHSTVVVPLQNDGAGSFTPQPALLTDDDEDGFHELVTTDLNGDGRTDLLAARNREDILQAINNGDGTFTTSTVLTQGARSITETAVGDLNGDGRDDFVVGFEDQRVSTVFAQADGSWSAPVHSQTAGDPNEILLADLDEDGDPDLVIRSSQLDQVSVKLNDGNGDFGGMQLASLFDFNAGAGRSRVMFADGNGDGVLDLFSNQPTGTGSLLAFLPGLGGGTFGDPVRTGMQLDRADGLALGDINNDGNIDAIGTSGFGGGYSVILGNGDGTFQPATHVNSGGNLGSPLLVDINNDGNLDFVEAEGRVLSALGNGDGTFQPLTEVFDIISATYSDLAAGDLNSDGNLDLVASVGSGNPRYHTFIGNGDGTFQDVVNVDPGNVGGDAIQLIDLNDDETLDLVGYGSGTLTMLIGDGAGGFTTVQNVNVGGGGTEKLIAANIDDDPGIELLVTDSSNSRMRLFQPNEDGSFSLATESFRAMQGVAGLDLADIDSDGDLDVAFSGVAFDNTNALNVLLSRVIEPESCDGPCRVINTYEPTFNQLTSTTDEHGRQTLFEIDPNNGNTLSIRRVLGDNAGDNIVDDLLTTFTYTARGQVETVTDPLGRVVRFAYDARGRQIRKTMAVGTAEEASVRTEYDAAGNVTGNIDENNNRTELVYDELNRARTITNALGDEVELRYDQNGNAISFNDLNGNVTRTEFDELDRPVRLFDAIGNAITTEYDQHGNVVRTVDRLQRETRFRYDKRNRLTDIINAEGGVMSYEYDFDNNIVAMTDENGNRTRYLYDARNRQIAEIDALGGVTKSVFDTVDNLVSLSDELGRTTTFDYDDADRLITMTLPDPDLDGPDTSPIYVSTYDLASNLVSTVDPLGNETRMVYDTRDRLVEQIDADPDGPGGPLESPRTQFTFDNAANVTSISDPLDRVTTFDYDALYRVTTMTLPDPDGAGLDPSPVYVSVFDAASNLITEIDPLGNETRYEYDDRYVLTSVIGPDPDGPVGPAGHRTTTFEYDAAEQLVSISDPLARTTFFTYDQLGRNTVTLLPAPDDLQPAPIYTNVFDPFGNVIETIDPLDNVTQFEFDPLHRPVTQTDADPDGDGPLLSPVTEMGYDAADQLLFISDPLQRVTMFAYDELARVIEITEPDPDGEGGDDAPQTFFEYDLVDSQRSITDALGNVTAFDYDNLYRLITQTDSDPDGAGPLLAPVTTFEYDVASQLVSQSDPLARVTSFEYDGLSRIIKVTEPDPDGDGGDDAPETVFEYDLVNNERLVTDPLGNVTEYDYDNLYRLTKRTDADPDGAGPLLRPEWDFTYDIASQLLSQSDPLDRTTSYEYDDLGRIVTVTQPDPDNDGPDGTPITTYVYDLANNQRSMTDPLGNVTEYDYDNLYRRTSITGEDPDGDAGPAQHPVWSYEFDVASQLTSATDPLDRTTRYDYDGLSRVVQVTEPDPDQDGPLTSPVMTYVYDLVDNETSMTDSLGNVTAYDYDNLYRLTRRIDADPDGPVNPLLSPETNFEYDVASQLTAVSDPLQRVTRYDYDGLSRVVELTAPDPDREGPLTSPVMTYVYDLVDNETSMTDSLGNVTAYDYDNLYRLTRRIDADPDGPTNPLQSPETTFEYDVASQLTSMSDPLNRETTFRYDELGRRFEEVYPDPDLDGPDVSPSMTYTFDLIGNVLTDTDGLGHTRTFEYDNLYRRVTDIDANGDPTRFKFDLVNNLLSLTDPVQNVTRWDYDDLNRIVGEINPLNDERTFEYDSEDNLIRKVDRNDRPTEFVYDNLYRQTAEVWFDAANAEIHRFDYSYDIASQALTAVDVFDAMTYVYDDLGRIVQKSYDITGLDPVTTLTQTFDSEDNRLSVSARLDDTDDFVTTYDYDNLYRPVFVGQDSSLSANANTVAEKRIDFTWDIASQRTSATRFADLAGTNTVITSNFDYDRASRITSIDHSHGATDLAGYDLSWDEDNRITRWASLTDGVVDYNYDDRNQLTGADYDFQANESYTYDENGNRIGGDRQTGPANRLAEDETYTYEYDPEGNRTRRVDKTTGEVTEYAWDHRNRLTLVTTRSSTSRPATQIVEHSYDAQNRWIRRRVESDGAGVPDFTDTFFIQDGNNIVLEFDGPTESDISHRYLWGTGIDEIMADENALGEVLWPLADHLGTVRDLAAHDAATNTTTIENHKTYDAFGNVVNETNTAIDTFFGYTGRPFDDATNLQNNLHRWYDAETGKWLSEDPIGFAAGDANLARYIANAATVGHDPDGLLAKTLWKLGKEGISWAVPELGQALVDGGVVGDRVINDIRIGQRDGQTIARPRGGTPYDPERINRIFTPVLHAALSQVYKESPKIGTSEGNINLAADIASGTVGLIGTAWYTALKYGTGNADSQSKSRVRAIVDLALDASRRGVGQRDLIDIVHRGDRISRYGALDPRRREDKVQRSFYKSILSEYFGTDARKKKASGIINRLNQSGISTARELEFFLRTGRFKHISLCEQQRTGNNPHARESSRLRAQIEQWRKQGYSMNMIGLLIEKRQREAQQNRSNRPMY